MRKLPEAAHQQQTTTQAIGQSVAHESASRHVTGTALYIDDLPQPENTLYAAVVTADSGPSTIDNIDLTAVHQAPGVVAIFERKDIEGSNDIGPVFSDDPLLTDNEIRYYGQPIAVVIAKSQQQAWIAVKQAVITYSNLRPAITTAEQAHKAQAFVRPAHRHHRGSPEQAIKKSAHQLQGQLEVGGQEHFYLEGQVSLAIPTEEGGVLVYSSTQHPSEVQKLIAENLMVAMHLVTVETRRMGGGFGGKETQAAAWACLAAIAAKKLGQAVKMRLPRQIDMMLTGKRHHFSQRYTVGFNEQGIITGVTMQINGLCGHSADLSDAIVDRAMFHADNAYYLAEAEIVGHRCRTDTVSHTAFRGFGGPQGMILIEQIIEDIAQYLAVDPLLIRQRNLYNKNKELTLYGQQVHFEPLTRLMKQLTQDSRYHERRQQLIEFNKTSPILKKGIALTPVKFGISFTVQHLNQAGALINIYTDGSVQVNHGGTEMGQGLHTKVQQIVAEVFGIEQQKIVVMATRTDKVPNTSPTAASSGTDLNGYAAKNAALILRDRLISYIQQHYTVSENQEIIFANNQISWQQQNERITHSFTKIVQAAYLARISLSTTGYYKTPKIYYDREQSQGQPFYYFAYGAAVSEVIIDRLTGEYKVLTVDILHDVGNSINPAIDIGQIEGGFIQGMGWLTTEELVWNEQGKLLSNNAATYKIPTVGDLPDTMNVKLFNEANEEATVYHSKAVGEPPFMLAISVWAALRMAISSARNDNQPIQLDTPATPERVLAAIMEQYK